MKNLKIMVGTCITALTMGAMYTVNAATPSTYNTSTSSTSSNHVTHVTEVHPMSTMHTGWHPRHHMMWKFANYGVLTPEQTTWLNVPGTATPGSRGTCWSNLMYGKVKLNIPNYGVVYLTPNNPVGVFAVPQDMRFSAKYCSHKKGGGFFLFRPVTAVFGMFGGGNRSVQQSDDSAPVRLICKF